MRLISYVNVNAQKHMLVDDFIDWPYSSFNEIVSEEPSFLCRNELFSLFDGRDKFIEHLKEYCKHISESGRRVG